MKKLFVLLLLIVFLIIIPMTHSDAGGKWCSEHDILWDITIDTTTYTNCHIINRTGTWVSFISENKKRIIVYITDHVSVVMKEVD